VIGQYVATMADAVAAELRAEVLARIDDDEVVRLASDLIRIPSFTTEETPLAEWLASYLADQGLPVTVQEIEPGRKQTIARLRGTGGGRSLMLTATSTSTRSRPAGRAIPSTRGSRTASSSATASTT
jgi:hypothetical protein